MATQTMRRPGKRTWTLVAATLLLGLAWPGAAGAKTPDDVDVDEQDTAPQAAAPPTKGEPHADCDHRMPLWTHQVSAGEHLGVIAGRYGVRQADLLRLNPQIVNANLIRVGDDLRVCPEIYPRVRASVEHIVAPGETLSEIAARYELTLGELLVESPKLLAHPNLVRVGQTLRFSVDGGLVDEFSPPPKRAAAKKRRGAGKPSGRRAAVAVQLTTNDDLQIKRPHLAWGTQRTVSLLQKVARDYRGRAGGGPKMLVGDLSQRGGGELRPHLSHRTGHDVDVGYVLQGEDGRRTRFSGVTLENLDMRRTWALLEAFLDTNEVVYIFMDYRLQQALYEYAQSHGVDDRTLDEVFQYPRGRGRNHGIVRHWRSHRHHFHVRFR
jgi:LysM repeat protein